MAGDKPYVFYSFLYIVASLIFLFISACSVTFLSFSVRTAGRSDMFWVPALTCLLLSLAILGLILRSWRRFYRENRTQKYSSREQGEQK